MKSIPLLSACLALALLGGCGVADVEDDTAVDESYEAQADNCDSGVENPYGCFGGDQGLGEEMLTEGYWSLYAQRELPVNVGDETYYNTYLIGYRFLSDGTVFKRDATKSYSTVLAWGVDENGGSITLENDGTFTIDSQFINAENCYVVSRSDADEDYKLCHDAAVDTTYENDAGYYGPDVTFGTYQYGDYNVTGTWTVQSYLGDDTAATVHTLAADGTSGTGANWGVSADGKVLTVEGISYLAYKYLKDTDCIAALELSGETITGDLWQFCR